MLDVTVKAALPELTPFTGQNLLLLHAMKSQLLFFSHRVQYIVPFFPRQHTVYSQTQCILHTTTKQSQSRTKGLLQLSKVRGVGCRASKDVQRCYTFWQMSTYFLREQYFIHLHRSSYNSRFTRHTCQSPVKTLQSSNYLAQTNNPPQQRLPGKYLQDVFKMLF